MSLTNRRRVAASALVVLLAALALLLTLTRPRPTATITTITGQRFTAAVFSRRVELARKRLLLLEKEAPRVESALGIVPPTLPIIRFYDASNFPVPSNFPTPNSWVVGYVSQSNWLMLCLDARKSGNTPDGLALVTVHEYAHLVTRWRAQQAGSTPPIWLWEGIAEYLSGSQSKLRADAVVQLSELGLSNPGLLYAESKAVVAYIAQTFGEDRLPLLIDAYSNQQGDAILAVCGISEPELLERLRNTLR